MREWIIALISGLLGSIIGAIGSAGATYFFSKKHTKELEDEERKRICKAFKTELNTVWKVYMESIGSKIEAGTEKEPPLTGMIEGAHHAGYLSFYDNNSSSLGLFDVNTSSQIIETYINLKALISEMELYGKTSIRVAELRQNHNGEDAHTIINHLIGEAYRDIKYRHDKVKKLIEDTTVLLGSNLV